MSILVSIIDEIQML